METDRLCLIDFHSGRMTEWEKPYQVWVFDTESHHSWHHPTVEYIVIECVSEIILIGQRAEQVVLKAPVRNEPAAKVEVEIRAQGRKSQKVTQTVLDEG